MIQYKFMNLFEFKHRKKLIFLQSFKNRNITIFIIILWKSAFYPTFGLLT